MGQTGIDCGFMSVRVQPELLRLFKQGTQTIGTDTADTVASEALWAELDAFELATV